MTPRKGSPPPPDPFAPLPQSPWEMEREKREAARIERERLHRERIEAANKAQAKRIEAANEEQRQLLAAILGGEILPHEIDPKLLVGDQAKETLLMAKRLWDVLFGFRLDTLAHDALAYLGDVLRDDGAEPKLRTDAAKTILTARAKMAVKANNPGEAAVRALLGGMGQKNGAADLRKLDDAELLDGFKRLLIAATDTGD